MTTRTLPAAGAIAAGALTLAGCKYSSTLTLSNLSGHDLTPYPVVTDPPPPHREPEAAGLVAVGGAASIDAHGFNPVYYASGIADTAQANGLHLGLQMQDEPYQILYRTFHYAVPPGQEGTDPALQPVLLHEGLGEIKNRDVTVTVKVPPGIGGATPGGWDVTVAPTP